MIIPAAKALKKLIPITKVSHFLLILDKFRVRRMSECWCSLTGLTRSHKDSQGLTRSHLAHRNYKEPRYMAPL